MRLKDTNQDSIDLLQEELEHLKEQDEKFWQDIEKFIIHSVPGSDKKGHWVEVRVRVRPSQLDLITAVREKHPPRMYKSQAELVRSLIASGTKCHFEFFKRKKSKRWKELEEILTNLNILGRQHRLQELKQDVKNAMNDLVNGSYGPDEKAKVIDLLSQYEKKLSSL
jgi:hypothetical protein